MGLFSEKRAEVISAVKTPLGLIALLILVLQVIFLLLIPRASGWEFSLLLGAMTLESVAITIAACVVFMRRTDGDASNSLAPHTAKPRKNSEHSLENLEGFWKGQLTLQSDLQIVVHCHLYLMILPNNTVCGLLSYEGKRKGSELYRGADVLRPGSESTFSSTAWNPYFDRWCHQDLKKNHNTSLVSREYAWECDLTKSQKTTMIVRIRADSQDPSVRDFRGDFIKQRDRNNER